MLPSTSRTLEIVELSHVRDRERGGENAFAECTGAVTRLDVDYDVDPRQRLVSSLFDAVGGGVSLPDCRPGRDADHDVREVLAARATQPEPAQLDRRLERGDRLARGLLLRVRRWGP